MPRILIIGLGLMGGSAGMALRRAGWHVAYVDARVPLDAALAKKAADEKLDAVRDEEVVLLATHVDAAVAQLRTLQTSVVITSLCSVMRPLREVAPANFVAGHPVAGSHESGLGAARADLFEGKKWFLDARDDRVEKLVRDCGGVAQFVDPETHDKAVALTSHLPQLLSTALAAHLDGQDVLDFAGSGLRDFLRLAGSGAEMWGPIVDANREQIAPHADAVAGLVRAMLNGDRETFAKAQRVWKKL
jgi:prephenate dehydrogenase